MTVLTNPPHFSVWLCYKYVKNPKQLPNMASPFCIVTALVDRMDFTAHNLKVGTLGRMDFTAHNLKVGP